MVFLSLGSANIYCAKVDHFIHQSSETVLNFFKKGNSC